ncbi:MAG: YihY/virulence factor BrkB family protein, partial [Bdellovibrionales bacterium]|nr:YihY/virulence factor BrkB family protein [Bdellovibrionales bacterium]
MDHGLLSRWHRFRVALLKTITVAFDPRLSLEASGLTYYTLLSLVPVLAFIFGIAKGFGLEEFVSEQIRHGFSEHEQVATLLLQFSQTLLG